jgi:alkylation response protein AidB-like acyl-CoA dehydrogenase
MSASIPPGLAADLSAGAQAADTATDWPARSWAAMAAAGATRWGVPVAFGGAGLDPAARLAGYEDLAAACLTTAFLLSQQDAAVRLLVRADADAVRRRYLPAAASGEAVLTIGVSQLTTSGQHRTPLVTARPDGPGFRVDGAIPWVTAADRADAIVAGAALAYGGQVLFALPCGRAGVTVEPPLELAALRGSRTARVRCQDVWVGPEDVVSGPRERVLGPGGGGGPDTSALALGLAAAAIAFVRTEASGRPTLAEPARRFEAALAQRRAELHALASGEPDPDAVLALRAWCTSLTLRATQAALAAAKGAGFVIPHSAQRWARQALFFLVWSCPRPVTDQLLAELAPER